MTGTSEGAPIRLRSVSPMWGAEALAAGCGLATVIISARALGAEQYGVVALAMAVPQLVYSLVEARSGHAAIRYIARYRSAGRNDRARSVGLLSFVVDSGIAIGALVISAVLAPWLAEVLLGDGGGAHLILGYALGVACRGPIAAGTDVLSALERFGAIAAIRGAGAASRLGATAAFLAVDISVEAVMLGFVVGMSFEATAMMVATHHLSRRELGASVFGAGLSSLRGQRRELARFIAYTDAAGMFRVLGSQADVLVLGLVSSTSEVGSYRLARQLIAPALSLIVPLQSVLLPRLTQRYEQMGSVAAQRDAAASARRIGLPFAMIFVVGVAISPLLVRVAGGAEFDAAIAPARWLMVLGAIWTATFWVQPLLIALGRVRELTIATAIGTAITLLGFWILGEAFGASGVAASRTIGMAVLTQGLGAWFAMRAWPAESVSA